MYQDSFTPCLHGSVWVPAVLFLLILSVAALLHPANGSSEAREVHATAAIISGGSAILPRRYGLVASKPPLFHWLGAGLSVASGISPLRSMRLVSVMAAAAMLIITMRLAGEWYLATGLGGEVESRWVGIIAGAVLSLTYGFMRLAMEARVDMLFGLLVTAAVASVLKRLGEDGALVSNSDRLLFYLLCGLAVLTKGPLGLVLPLVIVGSCLLWCKRSLKHLFILIRPQYGWLLFFIPVSLWYGAAYLEGGHEFLQRQIVFENVLRLHGAPNINVRPFWYYGPSLLRSTFPWIIFIPFAVLAAAKIVFRRSASRPSRYRLFAVPLVWLTVGVLFFSLAAGKRHSYLLPLYPALATTVSFFVVQCVVEFSDAVRNRWCSARQLIVTGVAGALVLAVGFLEGLRLSVHIPKPLAAFARMKLMETSGLSQVIFAALFLILIYFRKRRLKLDRDVVGLWLSLFIPSVFAIALGLSLKESFKPYAAMAAEIDGRMAPHEKLQIHRDRYDELFDPLLYHLHRRGRNVELHTSHRSLGASRISEGAFLLTRPSRAQRSRALYKQGWCNVTEFIFITDFFLQRRDRTFQMLRKGMCD